MKKPSESVVFKSIIGIILPLVLLSLIIGFLGYHGFTDGMLELYETGAIEIARTASSNLNADRMDAYQAGESAEAKAEMATFTVGKHELFPIPQEEQRLSNLEQNPNYS